MFRSIRKKKNEISIDEAKKLLTEAGVELTDEEIEKLADQIKAETDRKYGPSPESSSGN